MSPPPPHPPTAKGFVSIVPVRRRLSAWSDPQTLAMWGILLLAAVLRLACLDWVEFKADEVHHLQRGLEILQQRRLPAIGSPASVGLDKPPLMSWLMALPLRLGRDPRWASAFIALLNVAAVAGCYGLARRYYNRRTALIAMALFAANPWAVVFSRKIFTADLLAPFLTLYLYALHAALAEGRAWGWLVAPLALGVALGITFSPLPLVGLLAILVLLYRKKVAWKHLLLGLILALLLFAPYLATQARRLPAIWEAVRSLPQNAASPTPVHLVGRFAAALHSGLDLGTLAGASSAAFAPAHSALRFLNLAAAALFWGTLVALLGRVLWATWTRKGDRPPQPVILLLWLALPLMVVTLQPIGRDMHYLVILYPAGFVAMGMAVDRLLRCRRLAEHPQWAALLRKGAAAALVALIAWQSYTILYLYRFVARQDTTGGYGIPLHRWQEMAALTRQAAAAADQQKKARITKFDIWSPRYHDAARRDPGPWDGLRERQDFLTGSVPAS